MNEPLPQRWLTVDIGESTGWALLERERLIDSGTTEMWEFVHAVGAVLQHFSIAEYRNVGAPEELIERLHYWRLMVVEDWQLDPSTAHRLAWDTQDTVRGLGALQFIAERLGRDFRLQSRTIKPAAQQAGATDLFVEPLHENRHRNDAVMHAVYYAGLRGKGIVAAE